MEFSLGKTLEILRGTPSVLEAQLGQLSAEWIDAREAPTDWSPREVVAHLLLCEQENWMVRVGIIMAAADVRTFTPVDMASHLKVAAATAMIELLREFRRLRQDNVAHLVSLQLSDADLRRTAIHPRLGIVTLQQLLATWATHDLSHQIQIARTLARAYRHEVGPFIEFQKVLE